MQEYFSSHCLLQAPSAASFAPPQVRLSRTRPKEMSASKTRPHLFQPASPTSPTIAAIGHPQTLSQPQPVLQTLSQPKAMHPGLPQSFTEPAATLLLSSDVLVLNQLPTLLVGTSIAAIEAPAELSSELPHSDEDISQNQSADEAADTNTAPAVAADAAHPFPTDSGDAGAGLDNQQSSLLLDSRNIVSESTAEHPADVSELAASQKDAAEGMLHDEANVELVADAVDPAAAAGTTGRALGPFDLQMVPEMHPELTVSYLAC